MQSKYLLPLTCACLGALFCGCHSSKKAVAERQEKPKYINNVYIDPHKSAFASRPKQPQPPKATPYQPVRKTPVTAAETAEIKKRYSALLSVKPQNLQNIYLYKFIDRWYGINYQYGGTKRTGIDCSAFAQKLYDEVYGINLVRTAMEQFDMCRMVTPEGAKEGDLVFFHIDSKRITHVGIYLTNNFFVHSSTSGGVAISNLNENYWRKYYAGMGRVPGG